MNGTTVDFGTTVRGLAWNADGSRAAFVDGDGDLVTAKPDGSGRVVVARHIDGQSWSHPTWRPMASQGQIWADILFVSTASGVTTLKDVRADAVNGTPTPFPDPDEDGVKDVPKTADTWPNSGGSNGAVFANTQTGDVYILDDSGRGQVSLSMRTPGSEPAFSADKNEVVFVRSVGGHDHIFEQGVDGKASAKDLTPNATVDYTEPAISPDGTTIATRTPDGIATLPADGSAAPALISTYQGLPAYR
jgi:hypothetical protein